MAYATISSTRAWRRKHVHSTFLHEVLYAVPRDPGAGQGVLESCSALTYASVTGDCLRGAAPQDLGARHA